MERITLSRGVRTAASRASLHVKIQVRRPAVVVLLLAALLIAWAWVLPGLLRSAAGPRDPSVMVLGNIGLAVFLALGLGLFWRIAWFLTGWETLDISPRALSVRRSIGPFFVRRTYRFADLEDDPFLSPGDSGAPPWKRLFLETERQSIVLCHRDRMVLLTRNLDKAEGAYLLTAIRLWMQDR